MELISAGCSHQRHAGRPRQGCPALSPPGALAGMRRHARGCGDPRARRVEAARGGQSGPRGPGWRGAYCAAGANEQITSEPPFKSTAAFKMGLWKAALPWLCSGENGTRLCREAVPAHTCPPLRRSPAFIARIKGRLWWVFVCTVSIPLFTEETFRLLEFSLAVAG